MTGAQYIGLKGKRYTAGREIGRGGEGGVYELLHELTLVIKVYTEPLTAEKADKLRHMAAIEDNELLKFAAWPMDVVQNAAGKICGFVMKKLESYVPLHSLFSPMDRKKLFPDKGYNFLVHVARNLAVAFMKMHEHGIITGDVNSNNLLVNNSGMVALIDCDSFQISQGSRHFFCEVGVPGYTPPELLERGSFNNVVRTINTDSFSLAILIFQLLFLGRHPFTGRNLTPEDFDEEKAIRTGQFAYSLNRTDKKLSPAKNSFDLRNLNPGIIGFFHQAFEQREGRPLPKQWIEELGNLGKEMVTCTRSKLHQYPGSMRECPWCLFKEKTGIVYFMDDSYFDAIPQLTNIDVFVNGFKLEPVVIKKLSDNYARGNLTAAPVDSRFVKLKNLNNTVMWAIIAITIVLCFYDYLFIFAGVALLIICNFIFPSKLQLQRELQLRKNTFNALKENFEKLVNQHNNPPDLFKYNHLADKLTKLIDSFKAIPAEFNLKKKRIEERYYNQAYQTFLVQFRIEDHEIPSFGAAKKTLLYNNGIMTAADISRLNNVKITGIGPKNIQILQNWQRQMSVTFTYTPNLPAINREINTVGNAMMVEKMKLEADIRAEYKNLGYLRANLLNALQILEKQYHDLATKVYQAELDLLAFEAIAK
jgi:DNA-binding helix-hairpin-helix protein with protein kinase domain